MAVGGAAGALGPPRWKDPMHALGRLWRKDEGQDLVEYALLVTLIAFVVVSGVIGFGTNVLAWWTRLSARIPGL